MIRVAGSVQRSFVFPAERPLAYAYYADIGRVLSYLPHICLARTYGPDSLRLLYHSTELGIYRIRIFADVHTVLEDGYVLHVRPMDSLSPVQAKCSTDSTTCQGYFASRSTFHDIGDQTEIEYKLQLRANLPTPRGLRLMPGSVVNSIARGITHLRIHEIVEGFIERSVEAFPHWLEELRNHGSLPEPGSTGSNTPLSPDCPEELL
jgi:hypothetical protein